VNVSKRLWRLYEQGQLGQSIVRVLKKYAFYIAELGELNQVGIRD